MKQRQNGFTLIESMLVISIIAVSAGFIFAALAPARERGRQATCLSNLHQIGQAFSLYITDYDGVDPQLGTSYTHSQLGLPVGPAVFDTYLKSQSVLQCPSYHDKEQLTSSYILLGLLSEQLDPRADLPAIVAKKGAAYPLAYCTQHNANLDFALQARWKTKRIHLLRLNQQVQSFIVPVRSGQFDW